MSTAVTAHLRKIDPDRRKHFEKLRSDLAALLPQSEQVIKYGIPTFAIQGIPVLGFDAYKNHNSIFPYSGSFSDRLESDLAKYVKTKGSIHFDPDKPFPSALIKKIVTEKIKQINESYPKKSGEYLEFYPNGVLKAKGKYKAGSPVGTWLRYDKSGKLLKKEIL